VKAELAKTEFLCQRGRQGIRASSFGQAGVEGRVEDGLLRNSRQSLETDIYDAERVGVVDGCQRNGPLQPG
jgi:hypothetical protein